MTEQTGPAPLVELLAQARPRRLLAVGPAACQVAELHAENHGECQVTSLDPADAGRLLSSTETVDLALLEGGSHGPDRTTAPLLLGRLRDVLARVTLVMLPEDPVPEAPWRRADLRSLGYVPAGRHRWRDTCFEVYRFDIATYKTTPDWLSPEGWAHPELWDKYRW